MELLWYICKQWEGAIELWGSLTINWQKNSRDCSVFSIFMNKLHTKSIYKKRRSDIFLHLSSKLVICLLSILNKTSLVIIEYTFDEKLHKQFDWGIITDEMTIFHWVSAFRRVDSWFQVSFFPVIFKGFIEIWGRHAIIHDLTCVLHRHTEKFCQIFVIWVLLQVLFFPTHYTLSIPY